MGMTDKNLCDSCTNKGCMFQSGIVRTECAFYIPPHIEPDNCGNYVVMQPTVEAIPKADYENRLKAEKIAMLEELNKEFDEQYYINRHELHDDFLNRGLEQGQNIIQQKINALRGSEYAR